MRLLKSSTRPSAKERGFESSSIQKKQIGIKSTAQKWIGGRTLSIPLEKLIDTDKNLYEMTCVAIKEAAIISADKEQVEALENRKEPQKVVSEVLTRVLNDEIEYTPVESK